MEYVKSADGTPIAFDRGGSGPLLLLIHGAVADHTTTWRLVRPLLEEHFTVCAMDRRGRGDSGDGPVYSLQREAEDIAAVVTALGESVHVFGHSYGALCALESARLCDAIATLVLYEGVPLSGANLYDTTAIERLESAVARGDNEAALLILLREIVEMPDEEIAILRSRDEVWQRRVSNTVRLPRELRTEVAYVFEPARFASLKVPIVFFVGAASPARELHNARGVAAALADARVVLLPDQQHAAMHMAPEAFAAALRQACISPNGD
jgi:pimeloyl-ACP methyl ester carboxylesterase